MKNSDKRMLYAAARAAGVKWSKLRGARCLRPRHSKPDALDLAILAPYDGGPRLSIGEELYFPGGPRMQVFPPLLMTDADLARRGLALGIADFFSPPFTFEPQYRAGATLQPPEIRE